MENVKHIKNITIENFKCFDSLTVENFSKYNIVLGDNNVGKTSLLEALIFDENISQSILNFQGLLYFKNIIDSQKINPFNFYINAYSNINNIVIKIELVDLKSINFTFEPIELISINEIERINFKDFFETNFIEKEVLRVTKGDGTITFKRFDVLKNFEKRTDFVPFIGSRIYYSTDLIKYYSQNFANSKESKQQLIDNLQTLIPNISDVEISLNYIDNQPIIGLWLEDKDSILPLPMFGDGTVRLFRFIMELSIARNQYLCIDEIDTGIHFSRYKEFLKVILKVANQNNVQLFITTHNNEFLRIFKEVLEENDFKNYQEETKCFSLKKLPKGNIKAYLYNFDEFEFAIEQENELR